MQIFLLAEISLWGSICFHNTAIFSITTMDHFKGEAMSFLGRDVTLCSLVDTNVSEEHAASIFKIKQGMKVCILSDRYQLFGGNLCLHLQGGRVCRAWTEMVRTEGGGNDRDPKRTNKSKETVVIQGLSSREKKKSLYVNQQESG
jgi:hypothetical protein